MQNVLYSNYRSRNYSNFTPKSKRLIEAKINKQKMEFMVYEGGGGGGGG